MTILGILAALEGVVARFRVSQARALKVYAAQHDKDMNEVVSELLKKAGIE